MFPSLGNTSNLFKNLFESYSDPEVLPAPAGRRFVFIAVSKKHGPLWLKSLLLSIKKTGGYA
jgi:hypothetical protein